MKVDLAQRLEIFVSAGFIPRLPTRFQLAQAELEMLPYVLSTDATVTDGYTLPLGRPLIRQPLMLHHVGRDHLRVGAGLDAEFDSLCAHVHVTYHVGMPVFDLQLAQTHERGLERLSESIERLLSATDAALSQRERRARSIASAVLRSPKSYWSQFLGPSGHIARARRFEYPEPGAEGSAFPSEFYSLIGLINYAATLPRSAKAIGTLRLPGHFYRLLARRSRAGLGFGWSRIGVRQAV